MYTLATGLWRLYNTKEEFNVIILGLDNAGKTTLLEKIKNLYLAAGAGLDPARIAPTVGLNIGKVDIGSHRLNFCTECHSIVFVVDSTDKERIQEVKETFQGVVTDDNVEGVPVLMLANKQDVEGALKVHEIKEIFNPIASNLGARDSKVLSVSALRGEGKNDTQRDSPAGGDPMTAQTMDDAIDWALAHGLVVRQETASQDIDNHSTVIHAPFALYPSPFPRSCFDEAVGLQPIVNKLVHQLSLDESFIHSVMKEYCVRAVVSNSRLISLAKADAFMDKTYHIYLKSRGQDQRPITLGIHRSDYLLHQPTPEETPSLKQVEVNTIAASFGSLSSRASDLHRFLRARQPSPTSGELPENKSLQAVPKALETAYKACSLPSDAVVVMIIQPGERNSFDQRFIEYELSSRGIRLIRKSLKEISQQGSINDSGELIIDKQLVAVTYFRAGYTPKDYPSDAEWDARLMIEQSRCVKCPNVAYHIVGSKKVQQVLADRNVLSKYLSDCSEVDRLMNCFTGLYPLDESAAGKAAIESVLNPKIPSDAFKYVMKPQREGGGNNIYMEDVPTLLRSLGPEERKGYILMDMIVSPKDQRNTLVRWGKASKDVDVISELGVYGVWVTLDGSVLLNEASGHLLRTKSREDNEGGVASGFSVIDSPLLF
ncbi:MAG: hypothetical protein SGCHY_000274 [Lobulomycetales sp.]